MAIENLVRKQIAEYVPPEIIRELIKKQKGFKLENLYKDDESLLDELFRVCAEQTISQLFDDYCWLSGLNIWCHTILDKLSRDKSSKALEGSVKSSLFKGVTPVYKDEKPVLFRVFRADEFIIFKYAARDGRISIPVAIGQTEEQRYINQYDVVLHFSESPYLLVAGPSSNQKSNSVLEQFNQDISPSLPFRSEPLKQPRGKSRQFYRTLKNSLSADLVKTKRDDLQGNYKTITLEARFKKPDLEHVPDFIKRYRNADSYYDVLQFTHGNRLEIQETTNVKFGYPSGRFTFREGTSLGVIDYFFRKAADVLSSI